MSDTHIKHATGVSGELQTVPLNATTKRLYIAATRMNDGKTTTSLALFAALRTLTNKVGFIKPVGQRYVEVDGEQIDEDSVLLQSIFNVEVPMKAMSPISIHSNFTREFLDDPHNHLKNHIDNMCRAFDRAAYDKDYIIIEGTGHAGVGSVFDLSNAEVAKRLNAKVIIVAGGGIGRPIDEIALNQALFKNAGVEVIGAIINKVLPEKLDFIKHYCGIALERMGIPLLGCIPIEDKLSSPSIRQLARELEAEWLNEPSHNFSGRFESILIEPSSEKQILKNKKENVLIVSSNKRSAVIDSILEAPQGEIAKAVCGIVLTQGAELSETNLDLIKDSRLPFIITSQDSYSVASKINNMNVKTLPTDADKIPIIKSLITENVDLEKIQNAFGSETLPLPDLNG